MKKLIGLFLLIVLAIQVLPVKQVGSLLMSNQIQEEIPHSLDVDYCKKMESKSEFVSHSIQFHPINFLSSHEHHVLYNVQIPKNHSCEILVPPPNC
jgi:hypothetical protein